jgi:hypothetical protein
MNPLHWLALPLAVAAAVVGAPARAAGGTNQAVGQAIWNAATKGKTTTIAPGGKITTIAPAGGGGTPIGQVATAGNTASGGVAIAGSGTAPVNGKGVPVSATGSISKDALATAAAASVCAVASAGACVVAGVAVAALPHVLNWIDSAGVSRNPQTGALEQTDTSNAGQSDGYKYYTGSIAPQDSKLAACQAYAAYLSANSGGETFTFTGYTDSGGTWGFGTCSYNRAEGATLDSGLLRSVASACPAGYYVTPFGCYSASNLPKIAVTGSQLIELLKSKGGPPNPGVVQEVIDQGQSLPAGELTVTGPSTVPGPTTITITNTTNSGPVTTTTTTTNNYTYNGNSVTNTGSKTTTETKDSAGNTTSTTEETTSPGEEEKPEESPIDTPLGDVPKLYERKYPDGIVGIWNDKRQQLNQTQLFQLPQQLMPTGIAGGSCPTFKIPLDFVAFGDYGEADVSPPCWIYDVIKVIVLIGAAILARALIFGG